jgi:hypothetical protein
MNDLTELHQHEVENIKSGYFIRILTEPKKLIDHIYFIKQPRAMQKCFSSNLSGSENIISTCLNFFVTLMHFLNDF